GVVRVPEAPFRMRREESAVRLRLGMPRHEGLPVRMPFHPVPELLPVVDPRPAQRGVVERESQRLDQVQPQVIEEAQADDVSRIGRDFGFEEDKVDCGHWCSTEQRNNGSMYSAGPEAIWRWQGSSSSPLFRCSVVRYPRIILPSDRFPP